LQIHELAHLVKAARESFRSKPPADTTRAICPFSRHEYATITFGILALALLSMCPRWFQ
jgi:hypothetical protein